MSSLKRILDLSELLSQKSFFLFGPRATGKSTLITQQLTDNVLIIDLLQSTLYLRLGADPSALESIIDSTPSAKVVVIDEVQRIPELLNEVHRLIEKRGLRFLLTGSSARKLRRKGVNLLAGRAWEARLFPLISQELPSMDLNRVLHYGSLPAVYLSDAPVEELNAYVNTYLKEEIQAEALVRKIPAFSRFLQTSALTSGNIINFSSIASDTGVPITTVREYYQILEDTFLGFFVSAWSKSVKRKARSMTKFYFFDIGVKNTLANISTIEPASDLYGQAFEHFMATELLAYLSYRRKRLPLQYWQTKHGHEVDFIIGDAVAIEVKTTQQVTSKHLKGLKLLQEEEICQQYYVISHDKLERVVDGIKLVYWENFLQALWQDNIINDEIS